jgi:hypothetical protein
LYTLNDQQYRDTEEEKGIIDTLSYPGIRLMTRHAVTWKTPTCLEAPQRSLKRASICCRQYSNKKAKTKQTKS